jgi:hypothetical protein
VGSHPSRCAPMNGRALGRGTVARSGWETLGRAEYECIAGVWCKRLLSIAVRCARQSQACFGMHDSAVRNLLKPNTCHEHHSVGGRGIGRFVEDWRVRAVRWEGGEAIWRIAPEFFAPAHRASPKARNGASGAYEHAHRGADSGAARPTPAVALIEACRTEPVSSVKIAAVRSSAEVARPLGCAASGVNRCPRCGRAGRPPAGLRHSIHHESR